MVRQPGCKPKRHQVVAGPASDLVGGWKEPHSTSRPKNSLSFSLTALTILLLSLLLGALITGWLLSGSAEGAPVPPSVNNLMVKVKFSAGKPQPPEVTSTAALLMDAASGDILFAHNATSRLPMASTTKIMTALVALETLDLQKPVTVSARAVSTIGSKAALQQGEVFTVEQLLHALLVVSGNDAALALAEASAGSVEAFVAKMNNKAKSLGLTDTHFANPSGVNNSKHFSSARDLAVLTRKALENPVFARIVDTTEFTLPPLSAGTKREFHNHNVLLGELAWVNGVKTGSTPYAKYCVVVSGSAEGVSLIAVILGAEEDATRWKEARALLDYGLSLRPRTLLCDRGQIVAQVDVGDPLKRRVNLVTDRALVTRLADSQVATGTVTLKPALHYPVRAGEVLGMLEFTCEGRSLGSAQLLAAQSVEKPSVNMLLDFWRKDWAPAFLMAMRPFEAPD